MAEGTMHSLPPGMILILGALLVPFFRGGVRGAYLLLLPVLSAAHLLSFEPGNYLEFTVFDYGGVSWRKSLPSGRSLSSQAA